MELGVDLWLEHLAKNRNVFWVAAGTIWARIGIWLVSLLGVIFAPLIPLGIEAAKNADFEIKGENILLTAAVLAVGFFLTSESSWARFVYGISFLSAVTLDYRTAGVAPTRPSSAFVQQAKWLFDHPSYILAVVPIAQGIERFVWHVVQDRSFPDWLDNAGAGDAGDHERS